MLVIALPSVFASSRLALPQLDQVPEVTLQNAGQGTTGLEPFRTDTAASCRRRHLEADRGSRKFPQCLIAPLGADAQLTQIKIIRGPIGVTF